MSTNQDNEIVTSKCSSSSNSKEENKKYSPKKEESKSIANTKSFKSDYSDSMSHKTNSEENNLLLEDDAIKSKIKSNCSIPSDYESDWGLSNNPNKKSWSESCLTEEIDDSDLSNTKSNNTTDSEKFDSKIEELSKENNTFCANSRKDITVSNEES